MPTVAVLSMKGGVGKTTVALGLASAAWNRHWRTLVVDLDPQANASMGVGILDPALTVGDALADGRPGVAAEAIVPSTWGRGTDVLPSEPALEHRVAEAAPGSEQRLRTVLGGVGHRYDLVVVDCPPSLGEMSRNALHAASQALVVTEPGYFALRGAQQAVDAIDLVRESSNRTLQPPTIVLNRMRSTVAEHRNRAAELREVFDRQVSSIEIPERNAIAQAEGAGMPIHAWDSPAGRELAELFDSLLDRLFPGGLR